MEMQQKIKNKSKHKSFLLRCSPKTIRLFTSPVNLCSYATSLLGGAVLFAGDKQEKCKQRRQKVSIAIIGIFVFLSKRKEKKERNNLLQLRCVEEEKSL